MSDPTEHGHHRSPHQEGGEGLGVPVEVPTPQASAEALKLSEVAEILGVPSRRIQYLRERGTVTPSAGGSGRGNASMYTSDDIRQLRLIIGLKGLDEPIIQQISLEVDWSQDSYTYNLSPSVQVVVDLNLYIGQTCK